MPPKIFKKVARSTSEQTQYQSWILKDFLAREDKSSLAFQLQTATPTMSSPQSVSIKLLHTVTLPLQSSYCTKTTPFSCHNSCITLQYATGVGQSSSSNKIAPSIRIFLKCWRWKKYVFFCGKILHVHGLIHVIIIRKGIFFHKHFMNNLCSCFKIYTNKLMFYPLKNSNIFPSAPEESFLNFYNNFNTPEKFLCSLTRGVFCWENAKVN